MINVIYENRDILAVDKPAGISTIPERNMERESVLSHLSGKYPEKIYVVHRLDKETSGILIFAKNPRAHQLINDQFSSRTIEKTYVAITHGIIKREKGIVESPLRPCGSGRIKVDSEKGKPCITEYEVVKRLENKTMVRVHPKTGRRHQIRVHFYSIGHPIVGDPLYGNLDEQKQYPRMMLHASRIRFILPGGEPTTLESPLPDSFQTLVS
jgi:tRNA pseudouridine32 synthase/23S rRNA pseudouridine746 synthase